MSFKALSEVKKIQRLFQALCCANRFYLFIERVQGQCRHEDDLRMPVVFSSTSIHFLNEVLNNSGCLQSILTRHHKVKKDVTDLLTCFYVSESRVDRFLPVECELTMLKQVKLREMLLDNCVTRKLILSYQNQPFVLFSVNFLDLLLIFMALFRFNLIQQATWFFKLKRRVLLLRTFGYWWNNWLYLRFYRLFLTKKSSFVIVVSLLLDFLNATKFQRQDKKAACSILIVQREVTAKSLSQALTRLESKTSGFPIWLTR